jgi:hypothetical protein
MRRVPEAETLGTDAQTCFAEQRRGRALVSEVPQTHGLITVRRSAELGLHMNGGIAICDVDWDNSVKLLDSETLSGKTSEF